MMKLLTIVSAIGTLASANLHQSTVNTTLRPDVSLTQPITTNGNRIVFSKTESGLYTLPVSFKAQDTEKHPFLLSLYSSSTLLPKNCLGFKEFPCKDYEDCSVDDSRTHSVEFSNFKTKGHFIVSDLIIDDNYWKLISKNAAVFATECKANDAKYGDSLSGIIGLGVGNHSSQNFGENIKSFGVSFDKTLSTFVLEFNPEDATGKDKIYESSINDDLRLDYNILTIDESGLWSITNSSAAFDINYDGIRFPDSAFTDTFAKFDMGYNVKCTLLSNPHVANECTVGGLNWTMDNLPTIHLDYGDSKRSHNPKGILIKPSDYVREPVFENGYLKSFKLAIFRDGEKTKYDDPSLSNTIILGKQFMARHTIKYDLKNKTVTIWTEPSTLKEMLGRMSVSHWILIVVAMISCLFAARYGLSKLKSQDKSQNNNSASLLTEASINN